MQPATNIAVRAARQAGNVLLRYINRGGVLNVSEKGLNDYVTEVDRAAEQAVLDTIRRAYPSHAILAEESGVHDGDDFQWIIDPLDGTTNFLHGLPQFAVSIALRHRGRLQSAVVYDPLREEMYTAEHGAGALLNDRRIRVSARKDLSGALLGTGFPFRDHSQLDTYLAMFRAFIQDTAGIRRPGSAALDLAYVAAGRYDGFWELGLAPWDMAAGALLVREAGGSVSDLSGGDRYLDSGNIVAAGLKVHGAMLRTLKPFLRDNLRI